MKTTVIIATSQKRTDWIIERSLKSVYTQKNIDPKDVSILIIDDNQDEDEVKIITNKVNQFRELFPFKEGDFNTQILKNSRTRFMSGTGAWNTGIWYAFSQFPDGFISILDDDDEYLPYHLTDCIQAVDQKTLGVFQWLYWQNEDNSQMHLPFSIQDLVAEKFYIGNPGVQGSNMFFKTKSLIEIQGFDECFPNTTDRDLMIRFLWNFEKIKRTQDVNIQVIEKQGVIHYNHQRQKVNNNLDMKKIGLDLFYQKYKSNFSEEAYQKSLVRAKNYFNYTPFELK